MIEPPPLSAFSPSQKSFLNKTRTVYRIGDTGPGVVLMHEIPGMTPDVLRLALLIAQRGFRVSLPSLFGTDGRTPSRLLNVKMMFKMCVTAEFHVFAANDSSPIVDWLRELCKDLARETGGNIGAVGLCITGGFALSLTVNTEGVVQAPVMSEPSLPFPVPFTRKSAAVHLAPVEEDAIRKKPLPCIALRFTNDYACRAARFDAYESLLGKNNLIRIEIPSPDPAHKVGCGAHSVLTQELSDTPGHPTWAAFERVITFLQANLAKRAGN
jgi:dienelactone hydrolase